MNERAARLLAVSPRPRVSPSMIPASPRRRVAASILLIVVFVLGATGCRRDMQDQPKMKPYRGSSFFGDGLSARPPVEGTVPRGYLREDAAYFTGKKNLKTGAQGASQTPSGPQPAAGNGTAATAQNAFPDDVDTFPFPISEDTVARGRERYDIFCSVCHGKTGYGDGMIVRRGFRRAASFHDDRLRQAPVGHFFDAMTNGWGAMPAYAPQIPVQDRWAIVAYIRALQLSQQNAKTPASTGQSGVGAPAATPAATPTSGGHK